METLCSTFDGLKPVLVMVVVQTGFAGVNVFYKLATNDGMSPKVIGAYRFVFASAFLAPLAYFTERKSRPKMTRTVMFQAFICGLFGCSINQILYVSSLALTSATFTSAMANLVPAVTFILAISFRMEELALKTEAGKAKALGTLIAVSGALTLTFYKGIEVKPFQTHLDLLQHSHNHQHSHSHSDSGRQLLGALLALASCLSYSIWLVVQAKMSKNYPCQFSSTALMSMMAAVQGIVFALYLERDWSQWKLGWDIRLLAVAYGGIVGSGLLALVTWCVRMRGPVFVSVFTPLMLIFVAIAGVLVLSEKLYLGSILGSLFIVCGLYAVLWGKSKEMKKTTPEESDSVEIVIKASETDDSSINQIKNGDKSKNVTTKTEDVVVKELKEEFQDEEKGKDKREK